MPQVSITISAEVVAWYAAVVATIGLAVNGYSAWRDRSRISVSINPNMKLMNAPPYDPNKTYIDITVRNRGRRPVKISTVELKLFKTDGYVVINDSLLQHAIRVLTEENPRTNFFIEQNIVDPSKIEYALVFDEAGRMYVKYHRRGAWFRRTGSRIAKHLRGDAYGK